MSEPRPSAFDWNLAWMDHRDNLPHVRQVNALYFVTFRLGDSLPAERVAVLQQQREQWLRRNPAPHTAAQKQEYRAIWTVKVERLLDAGHGSCVLRDPVVRAALEQILRRGDGSYFGLGDFVIMPNHVHVLVHPLGTHALGDIMKAWKSTSARQFGKLLGRKGSYWMDEYFDHAVREGTSERFARYIQKNPERLPRGTFTLGRGGLSDAGVPTGAA
jgi:putative transposase